MMSEDRRAERVRAYYANPSVEGAVQVAQVCLQEGAREEAKSWFMKAARQDPSHPDLVHQLKAICTPQELRSLNLPPEMLTAPGSAVEGGALFGRVAFTAFVFPFSHGSVFTALLCGAGLIFMLMFTSFLYQACNIIFHAIMFSYVVSIYKTTAAGEDRVPIYGGDNFIDMLADYLKFFVVPFTACFLPYFLSTLINLGHLHVPSDLQKFIPIVVGNLGMIFFPIAFVLIQYTDSIWSMFNLPVVVRSLSRTLEEYILCGLIVAGVFTTRHLVGSFLERQGPFFGMEQLIFFVYDVFYVYTFFVTARVIGLFYRCCRLKLKWDN